MSEQVDGHRVPPADGGTVPAPGPLFGSRWRGGAEIALVLGLSLGQSAIYAVVSLVAKLTAGPPLRDQVATLNRSQSTRELLDLTYQLLSIAFALVPVLLALFLLSAPGRSAARAMGFDLRRPVHDVVWGLALAAVIGIPGIGVYLLGRELGVTATISTSGLDAYWWTIPVLILAAVKNAVLEEVVAVGYLMTRLEQLRWSPVAVVLASALLRGSYHLYQGVGMAVGNVVMGVVFGLWFLRTRRVMPLVVAHTALDVVSFVGYDLFRDQLGLP